MDGTYTKYFQKSKVFLYPMLGLEKGADFVPAETYVCWKDVYTPADYKYICIYEEERTPDFIKFEYNVLRENKYFENRFINNADGRHIFIFNYIDFKYDYDMFIDGRYSAFSQETKNRILKYFRNIGKISENIKSFLFPDKYHKVYAKAFKVKEELIKEVHEVCSKPNMQKETLLEKIPLELELLINNSLYLDKRQTNE